MEDMYYLCNGMHIVCSCRILSLLTFPKYDTFLCAAGCSTEDVHFFMTWVDDRWSDYHDHGRPRQMAVGAS